MLAQLSRTGGIFHKPHASALSPIEYTRKKLGIPPIPEVTPRHRKSFGVLKAFPTYPWEPPEVKKEMKARFERWHKGIEPIPERFKELLYREKDLAPGDNRTEDAEREIEHREEEEVRLEHRFLSARTQPERDEALRELLKLDMGYLNEPPHPATTGRTLRHGNRFEAQKEKGIR
jgi:hypothetical protein